MFRVQIEQLMKEKEHASGEYERLHMKGDYNPATTQVLHLMYVSEWSIFIIIHNYHILLLFCSHNPADSGFRKRKILVDDLKADNEKLTERLLVR